MSMHTNLQPRILVMQKLSGIKNGNYRERTARIERLCAMHVSLTRGFEMKNEMIWIVV